MQTNPEFERGWYSACAMRQVLLNNGQLYHRDPGGIRLMPNEYLFADLSLEHQVFCGMNVGYTQSIVAFGGPAMFTATLAASVVGNVVKKRRAEQMAATQWRFRGVNATLVTNFRILTFVDNQWLSWDHCGIMEIWPAPRDFSIILLYQGQDPIRMYGADGPALCVILAHLLYGTEFLAGHPEFGYMGAAPTRLQQSPNGFTNATGG